MGKRAKKLRKKLCKRGFDDPAVLVICTGKDCAPRSESRALVIAASALAAGRVPLTTVGCLGVCKKGPIAAAVRKQKVKIKKHVDAAKAARMIDKLSRG